MNDHRQPHKVSDATSKGRYVSFFSQIGIGDVPLVGGKNASLGEMYRELTSKGLRVPNGFAVTAEAYRHALEAAEFMATPAGGAGGS